MIRREHKLRAALCLTTLLVCTAAAEQLLRLRGYPAYPPLSYAHAPNQREIRKTVEFEVSFETNRHGLRYPDVPVAKPAGEVRVLLVGDSFTEGVGVAAHETFGARLEARLTRPERPVRFLNGGLAGRGPLEYGRFFLNVGLRFEPDTLLICLFANDVSDTDATEQPRDLYAAEHSTPQGLTRLAWSCFPRLYLAVRRLWSIRRVDPVEATIAEARRRGIPESRIRAWRDRLPGDLVEAARRGEFIFFMLAAGLLDPEYWTTALDIATPSSQARMDAMLSLLAELTRAAGTHGVRVGVVFIPADFQYDARAQDGSSRSVWREAGVTLRPQWLTAETRAQHELEQWAAARGIPWLDLTPHLRREASTAGRLTYPLDGHWNAIGHAEAAKAIEPWLLRNGLTAASAAVTPQHR